jgi:anti-anti-sigma regulatory factor
MPQLSFPAGLIRGVPVVSAPARLDAANAYLFQAAAARWAAYGYATLVLDMTATRICDPAAFKVMLQAHRRAQAEGGELRIVLRPALRLLSPASHDGLIPQYTSVADAVAELPAVAIEPARRLTG